MLTFFLTPIGKTMGAAVIAIAAVSGVYLYGKSAGRQETAVEALEKQVEAYKDRNDENDAVEALDPVGLCIDLGGVPDDCRAELRRVGEDKPEADDSDLSRGQ